jgi:hypothetical protein
VSRAAQRRNLERCLQASTGCDPTALSSTEAELVASAARKRNMERCLAGLAGCRPTVLSPAQSEAVAKLPETAISSGACWVPRL